MEVPALCRRSPMLLLFLLYTLLQVCADSQADLTGPLRLSTESEKRYDDDAQFVQNPRPLIGILSQPGDGDGSLIIDSRSKDPNHNTSYIAASYVKFVEAGGARAVPLIYDEPEEILKRKFAAINGILLPGGSSSLEDGPFYRVVEKLFNWALEANDKGDYFPVYGVCLGFEVLTIVVTKDHNILEPFIAHKKPGPLLFVDEAAKGKGIFKWFPEDLIEKVAVENLALENHKWGLTPRKFAASKELSEFFEVLTTTPDENKKVYVSTIQGRKYPVTGVMFHPEKNLFEWGYNTIPHSSSAALLTQSVANFVISEARKSQHSPVSEKEEQDFLIYNTNAVYSGKDGIGFFDQSYVF